MLVDLLLVFLTMVSCEAQFTRIYLEKNVHKRGINHSERAEFLYWHNYYRRQVENPSASNMIYLLYHKELETAAFDWAVQCNFQHGNFNFTRYQLDPAIKIGQNIAVRIGAYNIQNAVFRWFNEHSDYSYKDKSCKPGAKCGHYEQVAGAVVTHIGCAVVYCPTYINSRIVKGDAYNIVCDYYPSALRANWEWKNNTLVREKLSIYEQGQPCAACPDGYTICDDKLCRSATCLTLDDHCKNPDNTTTCLCAASVYPVYSDSGLQPPSVTQSSTKQTTVKGPISTIADLPITESSSTVTTPITKSASTVTTTQVTRTMISASESTGSPSLQSQTTAGQISKEISETVSAKAIKQVSITQSTRTESAKHEIYTSKTSNQVIVVQTIDETTRPTTNDAENRLQEVTTSKPVLPEIITVATSPPIRTMVASTSRDDFVFGDNITAYQEPFSSEKMPHMCFIRMSTRYLTKDDMLPKDPGVIGDELFQGRWEQIQRPPKISLQVMDMVDSGAVSFGCLLVTVQLYLILSVITCLLTPESRSI